MGRDEPRLRCPRWSNQDFVMPTVHSVPLPPPAPQTGVRMTCWVHIKHLLDKGGSKGYKKLFGGDDAARKEMKEDLKFMAYLAVPYRFLKAEVFKLFESKWTPRVPKVVDRLCKQYMRSNATARFWMSCDTLPGMPNHNNALEGLNGRHKEEATEWEKKPVAEYFKDHCEWFEDKAHQHWVFATKAEHKLSLIHI